MGLGASKVSGCIKFPVDRRRRRGAVPPSDLMLEHYAPSSVGFHAYVDHSRARDGAAKIILPQTVVSSEARNNVQVEPVDVTFGFPAAFATDPFRATR